MVLNFSKGCRLAIDSVDCGESQNMPPIIILSCIVTRDKRKHYIETVFIYNVIFKCFDLGNCLFPQASLSDLASVIAQYTASKVYGEVVDMTVSLSCIITFTCVRHLHLCPGPRRNSSKTWVWSSVVWGLIVCLGSSNQRLDSS